MRKTDDHFRYPPFGFVSRLRIREEPGFCPGQPLLGVPLLVLVVETGMLYTSFLTSRLDRGRFFASLPADDDAEKVDVVRMLSSAALDENALAADHVVAASRICELGGLALSTDEPFADWGKLAALCTRAFLLR